MRGEELFGNPIIAEQVRFEEARFVPDPLLGHRLPEGKDFIGEKDFISMEEAIREIKESKKKVIMNLGDSSTSGWDSDVITLNRERMKRGEALLPAFFQYKTYSDYLRDKIGENFVIINAGVPAYTSLQGGKRLELLIDCFKKAKVEIHYVTVYFGNNDSVWEVNREDKNWIEPKMITRRFRRAMRPDDLYKQREITVRVSADDYGDNMRKIIEHCRGNDILPIIIEPQTPIYWEPGTRVRGEELPRRVGRGSTLVYELLDEALNLWRTAIKERKYSDLKKVVLENAREKDYIVPRIKQNHLRKLYKIVQESDVAFVQINLDRAQDDGRYFIDYCHPLGEANKLIADDIAKIVEQFEKGERKDRRIPKRVSRPIKKLKTKTMGKRKKEALELPTEHYTLY